VGDHAPERGHLAGQDHPGRRKGKVRALNDFFGIVAAGPAFFVSSWLLMIFAGIVGSEVGIRPFGYVTAIVVTIGASRKKA
jgi:hypothetical protein